MKAFVVMAKEIVDNIATTARWFIDCQFQKRLDRL